MTKFFEDYGPSFLGLQILRLYNEIDRGGTIALASSSGLPSRVASLLVYLKNNGPSNISDLAAAISTSHQLVSQRIEVLNEERLVAKLIDPDDQRRTLIKLNANGQRVASELEEICQVGEAAYKQLFEEIGSDVFESVVKACHALEERSLDLRIRDVLEPKKSKRNSDAA